MNKKDFYFDLPENLIAKYPVENRSESRLLTMNKATGELHDHVFKHVLDLIEPGDLLVLNDTRVIPARLFGEKSSGGKIEVLIERVLKNNRVLAFVKASRSPRVGSSLLFANNIKADVIRRQGELFELVFITDDTVLELLEELGEIPLPHYMQRDVMEMDLERYQTVYAQTPGAVAAPTAGLHFDEGLLKKLQDKDVNIANVTLHVGAGTFKPVRVDNITEHEMHFERVEVNETTCKLVNNTKSAGGRVIAVGTTVVRSLESAARDGVLRPYDEETNIFIFPGYEFKIVDALITNFHLPESTLIMLVCAFAGREKILSAYKHAIDQEYRFYSYGDAMFIA